MDSKAEGIQQIQPSHEAYQIVAQYSMGGLIAEYKGRKKAKQRKVIGGLLFILLDIALLGLLIIGVYYFDSLWQAVQQAVFSSFIDALKVIGLILLYLVLYGFLFVCIPLSIYQNRNIRMLHCTEGLIYCYGRRTIPMLWHEIESVSESISATHNHFPKKQSYRCTLRLHGKKYVFNRNMEQASELGIMIEREITRRRIDFCWQQIEHGEKLKFGSLSISQAGLYKGRDMVPWDQISLVHIFKGFIAITKDGVPQQWPLVKVGRVSNFFLFVALIHQLADGRVSYLSPTFVFRDYFVDLIGLIFSRFRM